MKIKYEVAPAPTGRYRSFQHRGWPTGYVNDEVAVGFSCSDDYTPSSVKEGRHAPIRVRIAVRQGRKVSFDWRHLKGEFKTLDDAKSYALRFLNANPHVLENDK